MSEREVRGSVVNGYLKYIEKTWGKTGLADCKQSVKIDDIKIKDGNLYPYTLLLAVVKWISSSYGIAKVKQGGNFTVKNLGFLSYLMRFTSIETLLSKATQSFSEAYRFGEAKLEFTQHGATACMKDVSEIPENCEGWQGAFQGMLEITKTKGDVRKSKCQLKGDSHCEYEIIWK